MKCENHGVEMRPAMDWGNFYYWKCSICASEEIARQNLLEQGKMEMNTTNQGLYMKYQVVPMDGTAVDPNAAYFVLRYDEDSQWGRMGRETLWSMCKKIEKDMPLLAADLRQRINEIGLWRVFSTDCETFVAMDWDDLHDLYKELYSEDIDEEDWYEVHQDAILRIRLEVEDIRDFRIPDDAKMEEKGDFKVFSASAKAWAKVNGRGFLCGEE